MITITITALAAVAAIFAVMFFQSKKNTEKYEARSESLSNELNELKCNLARNEAGTGDTMVKLTRDNIAEFLKREKTNDVTVWEDIDSVGFSLGSANYQIDCCRLPQQFIIRKGYNMEGADINWDVLERAADETTKDLVMIKLNVNYNVDYDLMIVSTTHTIAALREDFNFFISLIADAEKKLYENYHKIMESEYPDECSVEQQEQTSTKVEDLAMKMADMAADQKKIRS